MPKRRGLQQLNVFPSHTGADTCEWGGYVWEYAPGHHLQNQWGWVAQHHLVAEAVLGRPLKRGANPEETEVVHHLNGLRHDNRPENLQVLSHREHRRLHARKNADKALARLTPEAVREALVGRTIREAAAWLGTTHMTLRNRFPEIVAPRKRRAPADLTDPKWEVVVRPYAADKHWTLLATARALGLGPASVRKVCQMHGILWVANKDEGRTGRPKKATPPK